MSRLSVMGAVVFLMIGSTILAQQQSELSERMDAFRNSVLLNVSPTDPFNMPSIVKELKITPAQQSRLKKASDKLQRRFDSLNEDRKRRVLELGDPPDRDARAALETEHAARLRFANAESVKEKTKILDRTQRTRLKQIELRAAGPLAFLREDVQEQLRMSPEQAAEIGALIAQTKTQLAQISKGPRDRLIGSLKGKTLESLDSSEKKEVDSTYKSSIQEATNSRKTLDRSISEMLTKRQRATFEKMLGEPFDLKAIQADFKALRDADRKAKPAEKDKDKAQSPQPKK
jgi:hypothetical protein